MSPKKCVFGCEEKLGLFSFPNDPALRGQWMMFVFAGRQRSCSNVFVCSRHFRDECFRNKAQFDAGFADRLKLNVGAKPTIKQPIHEREHHAVSIRMVQVDVMCCKSVGTDLSMMEIDDLMTEICQLKKELKLLRERDKLNHQDVSSSDQTSTELLLSVFDEEQKTSVNLLDCERKLKTEITDIQINGGDLIHSDPTEVKQEILQPNETEEPYHLAPGEESLSSVKTEKNLSPETSEVSADRDPCHTCPECGKTFGRKEDLHAHSRFHARKNLHTCDQCGKIFVHKSRYNVHMKLHNGEKPYRCDQCGKCFMWPNALKRHLLHHAGVRLYPCKLCTEAFVKASDLKRHKKSHVRVKPYVCAVCGKAYSELNYFKQHEKMHKGVSINTCFECGKTFSTCSYLKKHTKLHTRLTNGTLKNIVLS